MKKEGDEILYSAEANPSLPVWNSQSPQSIGRLGIDQSFSGIHTCLEPLPHQWAPRRQIPFG